MALTYDNAVTRLQSWLDNHDETDFVGDIPPIIRLAEARIALITALAPELDLLLGVKAIDFFLFEVAVLK